MIEQTKYVHRNHIMLPFIISFFTQDWEYPAHAKRLRQECQSLGIDSHIVELESTGSYRANCSKKPGFILESLQRFQKPLLWLDVDASIIKYPDELLCYSAHSYDLAAIRKKPGLDHWYVGSIWFNYTPAALEFVDAWNKTSGQFADDGAFQLTYANQGHNVHVMELDIDLHDVRHRGAPSIGPRVCFSHRISRGTSKQAEKRASKQHRHDTGKIDA
jgi:hypothetical protein